MEENWVEKDKQIGAEIDKLISERAGNAAQLKKESLRRLVVFFIIVFAALVVSYLLAYTLGDKIRYASNVALGIIIILYILSSIFMKKNELTRLVLLLISLILFGYWSFTRCTSTHDVIFISLILFISVAEILGRYKDKDLE